MALDKDKLLQRYRTMLLIRTMYLPNKASIVAAVKKIL
jgi:hypothetical protein